MITYKVTFFVFIFLIVKNVKGITVEKVESASKEATEIHFKKDGEIVFDIQVEQPLSSAGKPIFQRGKAALPNNLQIARAAYTPCHRMSSEIQGNASFCINYFDYQWFGGPDRLNAKWPVQSHVIKYEPYTINSTAGNIFGDPYWVTSAGQSFYITSESPLIIDSNNHRKNSLCFFADNTRAPYKDQPTVFEYEVCFYDNVVNAHKHALETYLKRNTYGAPSELLYRYPTYNTFNKYTTPNELNVLKYVNNIKSKNFKIGVLSISTGWETCYGSWTVDQNKFESIRDLVNELHSQGIRVMIEGHPYVTENCQPYFNEAQTSGRFVQSHFTGVLNTCWKGLSGGAIDFANVATSNWFVNKVRNFISTTGVDYIDYGGGATNLLAKPWPYLNKNTSMIPDVYATKYIKAIYDIGYSGTVSVGRLSQYTQSRTITKLAPKDKRFGLDNGLRASLIQLLNANVHGYVLTKSDLIGGSGSGYDNKELYIRWLQASIFMPSLQFSKLPSDFDEETATIARKLLDLREKYWNIISSAISTSYSSNKPVNGPLWWIAPTDETALKISDQYLLGDHMIVAPILESGQRGRKVYLPKGRWRDCTDYAVAGGNKLQDGPVWIELVDVPLDRLIFFVNYNAPYPYDRCW